MRCPCFVTCQINRVVSEHISHADMTASDVANTWSLIASEGDMKVYKSEIEDSGAVVQHPLKAVHTVKVCLFSFVADIEYCCQMTMLSDWL